MKTIIAGDVITIKEACELLNVSPPTLNKYIKKGFLHRIKDKVDLTKSYVLKSEVKNFLDTRFFVVDEQ